MTNQKTYLLLLICLCITGAVYLQGANSPLYLDSTKLSSLEELYKQQGKEITLSDLKFGEGSGRYISQLSFLVNISLDGELNSRNIKITNITLHLICGLFVFIFCRKLINLTQLHADSNTIALIVAILWLVSPMNTSSVLYAIQRMNQLSCLFTLCALISYLSLRASSAHIIKYTIPTLFATLAFLSKETGILVLLYIAIIETHILKSINTKTMTTAIFIALAGSVVAILSPQIFGYSSVAYTPIERLLSESVIVLDYIKTTYIPSLNIGIFYDGIQPAKLQETFQLNSLIPPAAHLVIIGLALSSFKSRKYGLLSFAILFFYVGHSIESTIIPIELRFDHRNYLPSLGLYLITGCVATQLFRRFHNRIIFTLGLGSYALLLLSITFLKIGIWNSPIQAYQQGALLSPASGRALANAAQWFLANGDTEKARAAIQQVINTIPSRRFVASIQLAYIDCITHNTEPSYLLLETSDSTLSPIEVSQALYNLTETYKKTGCKAVNINSLTTALSQHKKNFGITSIDSWYIDYYIAELYASRSTPEAIKFLSTLDHPQATQFSLQLEAELSNQKNTTEK